MVSDSRSAVDTTRKILNHENLDKEGRPKDLWNQVMENKHKKADLKCVKAHVTWGKQRRWDSLEKTGEETRGRTSWPRRGQQKHQEDETSVQDFLRKQVLILETKR